MSEKVETFAISEGYFGPVALVASNIREGFVEVTRQFKKSGELLKQDDERESLGVFRFEGPNATISVDFSRTIKTGDFENVKIGFFASMPCYPEELDAAHDFLERKVGEWMKKETAPFLRKK